MDLEDTRSKTKVGGVGSKNFVELMRSHLLSGTNSVTNSTTDSDNHQEAQRGRGEDGGRGGGGGDLNYASPEGWGSWRGAGGSPERKRAKCTADVEGGLRGVGAGEGGGERGKVGGGIEGHGGSKRGLKDVISVTNSTTDSDSLGGSNRGLNHVFSNHVPAPPATCCPLRGGRATTLRTQATAEQGREACSARTPGRGMCLLEECGGGGGEGGAGGGRWRRVLEEVERDALLQGLDGPVCVGVMVLFVCMCVLMVLFGCVWEMHFCEGLMVLCVCMCVFVFVCVFVCVCVYLCTYRERERARATERASERERESARASARARKRRT
jgi:uncharacterized membrane protein